VLYSSNKSGIVYVDTMNLDGETNLKEKTSLLEKLNEDKIYAIAGDMVCDEPNEVLDFWDA
jgi:magnesium-transporting ATPase (P-type)